MAGTTTAQETKESPTPDEAVTAAAKADGRKGSAGTVDGPTEDAALQWFLDDEDPEFTRTMELNVGTDASPRWITWTIKALDADEIRKLNRESEGNRSARRAGGERDPDEASRRIVAAATIDPDLVEVAKRRGVQLSHTDKLHGPMQILAWRFRGKSGLIVQLANDVMGLSGYDEEDIRGVQAGKS